jgi:hypothetical protein
MAIVNLTLDDFTNLIRDGVKSRNEEINGIQSIVCVAVILYPFVQIKLHISHESFSREYTVDLMYMTSTWDWNAAIDDPELAFKLNEIIKDWGLAWMQSNLVDC